MASPRRASGRSRRSCSTASATRPSPSPCAASSMKARPAGPASSASCATARSTGARRRERGGRPKQSLARRSTDMSSRRSAKRLTIMPIMWRRCGRPSWPRSPRSASTSSIAGPARGVSRRPSPGAMLAKRRIPPRFALRRGCGYRGDRRQGGPGASAAEIRDRRAARACFRSRARGCEHRRCASRSGRHQLTPDFTLRRG